MMSNLSFREMPNRRRVLRGIAAASALVLLNASVTFGNVWPTPRIRWQTALSVELAACVLVLALAYRWANTLARRVLPVLWVLLVVGRYADVTGPGLYGRAFNLYWDSRHIANVAAMLVRDAPWWLAPGVAIGTALALGVVYVLARLAFRALAAAVARPAWRGAAVAAALVIITAFSGQQVSDRWFQSVVFADPVTPTYARQAQFALGVFGPRAVAPLGGISPAVLDEARLEHFNDADVLLVFMESYGAITYDAPDFAAALAPARAGLEAAVRETGRRVASAFVQSPTFGASSWLAHLSLMTGVDVRDQYAYTRLMAQARPTLATAFARRGYRTVALMPGMRQPWPEGAFYGFDIIYGRAQLGYRGPEFGWWGIPDQYTLAALDFLERDRLGRAPLFVFFPTSTTHAPFGPVAPYQPEWARLLTTTPYDEPDLAHALGDVPDLMNLSPGYLRGVTYGHRTLAGYLRRHPADDMLVIVVGDHQPPAAVSGRDASWEVPVHVLGRAPQVDRLLSHGFRAGLDPERPAVGAMHELVVMLLDATPKGPLHATTEPGAVMTIADAPATFNDGPPGGF